MIDWQTVTDLTEWLDSNWPARPAAHRERVGVRLLKVGEEYGEAVQAWFGMTGLNHRKGVTHSSADLMSELVDTMVTIAIAMETIAPGEAEQALRDRMQILKNRIDSNG